MGDKGEDVGEWRRGRGGGSRESLGMMGDIMDNSDVFLFPSHILDL